MGAIMIVCWCPPPPYQTHNLQNHGKEDLTIPFTKNFLNCTLETKHKLSITSSKDGLLRRTTNSDALFVCLIWTSLISFYGHCHM